MEGLSMSMSIGVVGISVDDNTGDACGGFGGGWSLHEEAHDMCGGEGEGGWEGLVDDEAHSDMCGIGGWATGGSMDEIAYGKCREEVGGGMFMDDASVDISGLGR